MESENLERLDDVPSAAEEERVPVPVTASKISSH